MSSESDLDGPDDLQYFHENIMNSNLMDFFKTLPTRLQKQFKASLHGIQIIKGNVLQGYRGPTHMCNGGSGDSATLEPSHGLQEIRYWWAFWKGSNLVPVIGTAAFVLNRTIQSAKGQMEWSSLYFDAETGECLGTDKDEAAEKLNTIGLRLYLRGKEEEAIDYLYNAYYSLSVDHHKRGTFLRDADTVRRAIPYQSDDSF